MKKTVRNCFAKTRISITPSIPPRVKKEFKEEVCINNIVAKMKRGISPPSWLTANTPRYGDFSSGPQTLMEAFDVVQRAQEAFLSLPVEFRRELDHDPRNLDRAPRELFERFGLIKPKAQEGTKVPSGAAASPEGQGDQGLPAKGRMANKKGGQETPSADT